MELKEAARLKICPRTGQPFGRDLVHVGSRLFAFLFLFCPE